MKFTLPNPAGSPIVLDTDIVMTATGRRRLGSSAGALRRTQTRILIATFLIACFMLFYASPPLPPSYGIEKRIEKYLPQHDRSLPYPEGMHGRFVKFDTPKGTGFSHLLQRVLVEHHVALLGNRSLAFEPFTEDDTFLPFQLNRWPWRSAQIPLTALVANVLNGFEKHYHAPRAVSYYSSVCPGYAEVKYTIKSDRHPAGNLELSEYGPDRIQQLRAVLNETDKSCVHIIGDAFDDKFFDSKGPIEIIDELITSPVLKHFTFSPTVLALVNRMLPAISPSSSPYSLNEYYHAGKTPHRNTHWKHILALHLPSGDGWENVCHDMGVAATPFAAFNKLPALPGNENVPPPADMVEATRLGLYKAKCLPDVTAIIARARRMRKNHPLLRSIYIMTDAPESWCEEVRRWLASDAWDRVFVGKVDVYPDWADHEIGVAADMEIARRAGVFVGNGFSTISSTIVLLRTRDELHPDFTQFW